MAAIEWVKSLVAPGVGGLENSVYVKGALALTAAHCGASVVVTALDRAPTLAEVVSAMRALDVHGLWGVVLSGDDENQLALEGVPAMVTRETFYQADDVNTKGMAVSVVLKPLAGVVAGKQSAAPLKNPMGPAGPGPVIQ